MTKNGLIWAAQLRTSAICHTRTTNSGIEGIFETWMLKALKVGQVQDNCRRSHWDTRPKKTATKTALPV